MNAGQELKFTLPVLIAEPSDVRQILRELEDVDEFLRQSALRKPGTPVSLPRTTKMLNEIAEVNQLNMLQPLDRAKLTGILERLMSNAPVVHISFASDPSAAFITKVLGWFRQNIHPLLLVQIGLQPTIAAGCTLRTDSKYFDFSLRATLLQNRQILIDALSNLDRQAVPVQPTTVLSQKGRA